MTTASQPYAILVVDDDARWRKLLAEILSDAGYAVTAVSSPEETLTEKTGDTPTGWRLAVLDVSLEPSKPDDRSGLALADRLAPAPVILFSGIPAAELDAAAAAHPNVAAHFDKGAFQAEALLAAIRRTLAEHAANAGEGASALIVEDDAGWRSIYSDILGDAGYGLQFAVSYGEARGLLQRGRFDVAIVDLHLISSADPEENRDGFWLLRAAGQRGLPTIVVSAIGAPEDIDRAYDEFGVFAFVEKEAFDRRAFAQTVAEAIRVGSAPPPPAGEHIPAEATAVLDNLTDREREVLALMAQGCTNRQIGEALTITPNTVKKHVDHVLQKLGVSTRSAAAAIAARAGLGRQT